MSGDVLILQSMRLRCDSCGYESEPVGFDALRQHIGATCPKCAAVMVTEEDCLVAERMLAGAEALNKLAASLGLDAGERPAARLTARTTNGGEVVAFSLIDDADRNGEAA